MPEKASIPEECLSPKQVELNTNNRTKHNPHQQYLLQTMWDKHQYFVYGELLDFYLQHGVEIAHLYCGIVFNVKEWLKPYVDKNTALRNHCKEKGLAMGIIVYKLMNNAIYGWKFLQNVMKQSRLKFVNSLLEAIKVQSLPGFVRNVFHNGNFSLADVMHEEVLFDKPIYLGATITELAKLHMYRFYYNHVLPHWGRDRVQLLMTDTDSLMLQRSRPETSGQTSEHSTVHMRTG